MSSGIKTRLGLGPFRLGGKVGAGFGGVAPGTWYEQVFCPNRLLIINSRYEPISEEESLLFQTQLGLGLGGTNLYTGAGAGVDLEKYKEVEEDEPSLTGIVEVGEFVPVGEVFYVPQVGRSDSLIDFEAGAVVGPLRAGERFTVGSGSVPRLRRTQNNIVGVSEGLSLGNLNFNHQSGLGYKF